MKSWILMVILVLGLMTMTGCSDSEENIEEDLLVIYSPHPLDFIDPIITEFENETGIAVQIISAGTGELLSRIESEAIDPKGDVLWGGSLSSLAPKEYLFESFHSANEEAALYKNTNGMITRFSLMPSVIMVNTNLIGSIEIQGYQDLLNPDLKGRIAFADPAKSSSSYEQLINQLWAFQGEDFNKGWAYVDALLNQMEGKLVDSSRDVYTGVVEGEYFVGLTFEEAAAQYIQQGAPVAIIYPEEGTVVRPDGVAVIKDAKNMAYAKRFINFVTSYEIQHLITTELNRRSIRNDIEGGSVLAPLKTIVVLEDDPLWATNNKDELLATFRKYLNQIESSE